MKISASKKQLAKIISENGGWREGAEFAAQDGDGTGSIDFFKSKPRHDKDDKFWRGHYDLDDRIESADVTIKNWHQTIVSRDEYFHLYPAPYAEAEQKAEIRWVRGKDIYATPTAHDCMKMLKEKWGSTQCGCDECSAFYSKSAPGTPMESTIEQLAADYRNRKDYAERKQQEADEAKAEAEAKLKELVAAGKAVGLVVSVAAPEPELGITDWRDLRVLDIVWIGDGNSRLPSGEYEIKNLADDELQPFMVMWGGQPWWPNTQRRDWHFIRRP